MLLAPALGPARPGDRRAAARGARGPPGVERRADRGRGPGLRQRLPRRPLAPRQRRRPARRGRGLRPGARRERPERVLVEFVSANPTGPLTVASGPWRRLRRLAGAAAGADREPGRARVPAQRRRRPGAALRRVDRGAHAGREPPEDGYRGEYVAELAGELAAEGADPADLEDLARRGTRGDAGADRGHPGALRGALRHLVLGALAARGRQDRGGDRAPARARPRLRVRGRGVAADERAGRRQGPGPGPLRRRADLLRGRHRLPPRQARAGRRSG